MNHHLEKSTLPHSHLLTPGQWGREVVLVQDSEQGESYVSTRILRLAPPGGGHRRTIPLAETIGHELSGISAREDAANAAAYAAYAADAAAYAADARKKVLFQSADIVRKHYPWSDIQHLLLRSNDRERPV
mgnify:CR=1 FL=1